MTAASSACGVHRIDIVALVAAEPGDLRGRPRQFRTSATAKLFAQLHNKTNSHTDSARHEQSDMAALTRREHPAGIHTHQLNLPISAGSNPISQAYSPARTLLSYTNAKLKGYEAISSLRG